MLTYIVIFKQNTFMKKMIPALLFAFVIVSCTKPKEDVQIDPNKPYYMKYQNSDQLVKMRVSNDTLRMNFYENISILVDPNDHKHSWALELIEDFSKSYLNGLHFDAYASDAGYAHDWVPINLNTAAPGQVTTADVTVNGKQYVQISVSRVFEFYNKLGTHQAALDKQNTLLQTTSDSVTYKMFYYYNRVYSLSNDGVFKIVYQNQ